MGRSSNQIIGNERFYLINTVPTYFGIQDGYLDMQTMKYRVFGAVWKAVNDRKYILGYWFGDNQNEIHGFIKDAGFNDIISAQPTDIKEIYQIIRMEQDKENWSKRSRLNFFMVLKKPWKNLKKGWYVLKSSSNYPMTLTCIQKKRFSVWIEHIQVCENLKDTKRFLNLINSEHHIQLQTEGLDQINYKKN
ncbi:MAG: hypothetical protein Q8934_22385 [Bacillota bacterium]|nr:hypothetical protein [Bacillota bacterium]